ncbi:hypothetical protein LCGC14_0346120 [marine sediment metagenome]|uniref:Uncharacterized protein n=1 Tax=marine sediment metagenome TaxID=412755 RepID=A0A0F9TC80_9ZZZZ
MKIPTLDQLESYARLRNLAVNCADFLMHYEDSDPPWTKKPKKGQKQGDPVYNWKLTMQTWHRVQLERGGMPKCSKSGCKLPGAYIIGKDRDGHPYRYCLDHRPQAKPGISKEMAGEALPNTIKLHSVNKNNRRNELTKQLKEK